MLGAVIAKQKVRAAFSYFNDRDMEKFLSFWADDAMFTYPGEVSASGMVKGKIAIEGWFTHLMDAGPLIHFTLKSIALENIFDFAGTNVVSVEWENNVTNRAGTKMASLM